MVGCASFAPPRANECHLVGLICPEDARKERVTLQKLLDLAPPNQKAVLAVYEFKDLTGRWYLVYFGGTRWFRPPDKRASTHKEY